MFEVQSSIWKHETHAAGAGQGTMVRDQLINY